MFQIVRELYRGLFKDLEHIHPSIKRGLSRDLSRLLEADLNQGLAFYTLTLPLVSKYLLGSLEQRALLGLRPPLCAAKSKVDARPRFLYDLWSSIFESDGTLKEAPDTLSIRSIYQIGNLMKKLRIECDERYNREALYAFKSIEESLPKPWDNTWDHDDPNWCSRTGHPIWGPERVDDHQTDMFDDSDSMRRDSEDPDWGGFRNFVAKFSSSLGDIHSAHLESDVYNFTPHANPKHGPGAVSDKNIMNKYDGFYWTRRLECVFPYDYWASSSFEVPDYVVYKEHASQLMAVPKDQKGPRLIAAEPTAHQWIQGFIERWLETRIKKTILAPCINFRRQDLSQDLVLRASSSQSHATIDLSSASDRLTTRLVEYCFQGNRSLLDSLHACRTRVVKMPDGEHILLRKFSTQGSACTFPVQTIVFALLSLWAIGLSRGKRDWDSLRSYAHEVRVFGDDIIVPNDAYRWCTLLLEECKLKVNANKSFSNGKFRESCGMDAYDGEDITPTYIRELYSSTPTSLESVVECANNLHQEGWWNTSACLLKTLPFAESKALAVKGIGSGAFALVSFCGKSVSHLKMRYNYDLQQDEVQILSVQTAVQKLRGKGHGDLVQFFIEEPGADNPYSGGQVFRLRRRKALKWVAVSSI